MGGNLYNQFAGMGGGSGGTGFTGFTNPMMQPYNTMNLL